MSGGVRVSSCKEAWPPLELLKKVAVAQNSIFLNLNQLVIWLSGQDFNRHVRNSWGILSTWHPASDTSRYIPLHLITTQTPVITPFLLYLAALDETGCVTYLSLEHPSPRGLTAVVIVNVTAQIH